MVVVVVILVIFLVLVVVLLVVMVVVMTALTTFLSLSHRVAVSWRGQCHNQRHSSGRLYAS